MRVTTISELRRNLASAIDAVNADHEPLLIVHGDGKPAAVLMSFEDFESHEETVYLLRGPENARPARVVRRSRRHRARAGQNVDRINPGRFARSRQSLERQRLAADGWADERGKFRRRGAAALKKPNAA